MRQACQELFAAHLPVAGVAAVAVRLPDGMLMHQCFDRWLTPAQVRQALGRFAQQRAMLDRHQLDALRITWEFEHLRVEVVHRPDSGCLALFLANRPDLPLEAVEAFLTQFVELVPSGLSIG